MPDQQSDAELIQTVLDGNTDALGPLLGRYEQPALRYAVSIVGNGDDAEDVLQTAFIKAYRNLRAFDIKRSFQPWLFRIVRNEALNWLRKHRRTVYGESAQLLLEMTESDDNVHADAERNEVKQMVRDCLFDLPLKYREPLLLYYLQQRSYKEISDIMRVPIGTVGTNITRGKQKLKEMVEGRGHHG